MVIHTLKIKQQISTKVPEGWFIFEAPTIIKKAIVRVLTFLTSTKFTKRFEYVFLLFFVIPKSDFLYTVCGSMTRYSMQNVFFDKTSSFLQKVFGIVNRFKLHFSFPSIPSLTCIKSLYQHLQSLEFLSQNGNFF